MISSRISLIHRDITHIIGRGKQIVIDLDNGIVTNAAVLKNILYNSADGSSAKIIPNRISVIQTVTAGDKRIVAIVLSAHTERETVRVGGIIKFDPAAQACS